MKLSQSEKNRLKKKYGEWALVTGASSGIGLAIAKQLAVAGINLIINSRRQDRLQQVAIQLAEQGRIQIETIAGDVAEEHPSLKLSPSRLMLACWLFLRDLAAPVLFWKVHWTTK